MTKITVTRERAWMFAELLALFFVLAVAAEILRLIQAGVLPQLSEEFGYAIMTLHGDGMPSVFFMGSLLILRFYLEDDADVGISPQVWETSIWLFRIGVALLIVATFGGGFAAGWFELYPILFGTVTWPWWASVTAQFALLTVGIALLIPMLILFGEIWRTIGLLDALAWRHVGSVPTAVLIAVVTIINGVIAIAAGAMYVVLMLWQLFDPTVSFNPQVMKFLVFVFGHGLVNTGMYMAVLGIYAALPRYSGRPWKTTWYVALAWGGALLLIPGASGHHFYMDFAYSHAIHLVGQAASLVSVAPLLLVTVIGAIIQIRAIRFRGLRLSVTPWFFVCGFAWWLIGGFAAVIDAIIGFNSMFHNTLWVPAHFHTYGLLGYGFFLLGGAWDLLHADERLGKAALFVMNIGGAIFVSPFYVAGLAGVLREYASYNDLSDGLVSLAQKSALIGFVGGAVFLAGLLALLGAFVYARK